MTGRTSGIESSVVLNMYLITAEALARPELSYLRAVMSLGRPASPALPTLQRVLGFFDITAAKIQGSALRVSRAYSIAVRYGSGCYAVRGEHLVPEGHSGHRVSFAAFPTRCVP